MVPQTELARVAQALARHPLGLVSLTRDPAHPMSELNASSYVSNRRHACVAPEIPSAQSPSNPGDVSQGSQEQDPNCRPSATHRRVQPRLPPRTQKRPHADRTHTNATRLCCRVPLLLVYVWCWPTSGTVYTIRYDLRQCSTARALPKAAVYIW